MNGEPIITDRVLSGASLDRDLRAAEALRDGSAPFGGFPSRFQVLADGAAKAAVLAELGADMAAAQVWRLDHGGYVLPTEWRGPGELRLLILSGSPADVLTISSADGARAVTPVAGRMVRLAAGYRFWIGPVQGDGLYLAVAGMEDGEAVPVAS